MAKGTIYLDTKQLDRLAIQLKGFESQLAPATIAAFKRTAEYVVTQAGKIVPKYYAIKGSEVKASFKGDLKYPSKSDLSMSVESKGHTLSFAHFPYVPKAPVTKIKKSVFERAVRVTIKKNKGQVVSKRGFVATTGAKSEDKTQFNVFMRLGKSRFPIAPIRTLSIPQMITNENVADQLLDAANKKMAERLEHEITFRMTRSFKGSR